MRILLKFSVAEAVLTKKSAEDDESRARDSTARLFWGRENLGMGSELGGGELEYAGPAQSSEKENSSVKVGFLGVELFLAGDFGGKE